MTVENASAVPSSTGLSALVMLSVDDTPESEVVARSTIGGVAGAATSTTTCSGDDAPDVIATTVAVAVMSWMPAVSVGTRVHTPEPSAVTVPISVAPS